MTTNRPPQQIRTSWYQGAGILADDFGSARDDSDGWTARHVAVVHDTWGVIEGLELSVSDGVLEIGPGVAADCHGRELVLADGRRLAVAMPSDRSLVHWFEVILQPAVGADPAGRRASVRICSAGAGDPSLPAPPLSGEVALGREIPLGRVVLRPGDGPAISPGERRQVGRLTRPRIASGTASAGSLQIFGDALLWGAFVSTTSAGFTTVPEYSVWLGEHPFGPASAWASLLADQGDDIDFLDHFRRELLGPMIQVSFISATGFYLTVRMAYPARLFPERLLERVAAAAASTSPILRTPVDIHWTGVEPRGGCEPEVGLQTSGFTFGVQIQPQPVLGQFLLGDSQ